MQAVPACTGPSSSDLSFGALPRMPAAVLPCRQLSPAKQIVYFDGLPYKAASSALCEMLPRRMAGVICCLLLVFLFSFVFPLSTLAHAGVMALWWFVWSFHATRALPLCFLGCLQLFARPALYRRQSCQSSLLSLCFTRPGRVACLIGSVCLHWSLASFVSFLAPFSLSSQVCASACASESVACGLVFGPFTRPGRPPYAF